MGLFNRLKSLTDKGPQASPPESPPTIAVAEEKPFSLEEFAASFGTEGTESELTEAEFTKPSPATESAIMAAQGPAEATADPAVEELEDWSEPLPSNAPEALAPGTQLEAAEGAFTVLEWLEARGGENIYAMSWLENPDAEPVRARVREGTGAWGNRLARETSWRGEWDSSVRMAMLPRLICGFQQGECTYLATEMPTSGENLAQFFARREREEGDEQERAAPTDFVAEILLILTQVAAFLVRLHGAGYAHLGLRPEGIVQAKPVQILDCSFTARLGGPLETPLSIAGYSAPELMAAGTVDARSDIYAVGALLYRAVTGSQVPETGVDFTTWQPQIVMAGVPQLLRRCLGAMDTRFNAADDLHRALMKLKARLRPAPSHAIFGTSTIGLEPTRSTNQDAFGFCQGGWETESGPLTWTAFCVSDGMGGMAAGEVASEAAVNAFMTAASEWNARASVQHATALSAAEQAQLVKDWANLANEAVVGAMTELRARGGCTLDAGLLVDRRLALAHVGDSRVYLLRDHGAELLTRDHSYVMSLVLQGQITIDEIRTHSDRNKVTRSLGERHPQPEYFVEGLQVNAGSPTVDLQVGDILLACSDGLWEQVLETEMLDATDGGNLPVAGQRLLRLALQRGAPDNATLILLRLDETAAPVFA